MRGKRITGVAVTTTHTRLGRKWLPRSIQCTFGFLCRIIRIKRR